MTETKKKKIAPKESDESKKITRLEKVMGALLKQAELKVVWDGNTPMLEPDVTPETLKDRERRRLADKVGW